MNSISRQMAMVKFYVRPIYHNLKVFAKWAVFSSITGLVVGAFSTLFAECLKLVTQFRTANPWMILLLPLVGIVIVFLYHIFHYKNDKGTNMVLSTIHLAARQGAKVQLCSWAEVSVISLAVGFALMKRIAALWLCAV